MIKFSFYFIILLHIGLGIFIAYQRHHQTQIPFLPGEETKVWLIEAKVEFLANPNTPTMISLSVPSEVPNYKIFFEQSSSAGYGFNKVEENGQKKAQWSIREATSKQTLYYKVQAARGDSQQPPTQQINTEDKKLSSLMWTKAEELAIEDILSEAKSRSSNDETLTIELIKLFASKSMGESSSLLLYNKDRVEVINAILNQAGVQSRIAMGLKLEDARRNQSLISMIEIYTNGKWVLFDTLSAEKNIEESFFLWHRGNSLLDISGAEDAKVTFSMIEQNISNMELAKVYYDKSIFRLFSIHSLPIEEQGIFKMLLLLPLGALITVFLRLIVGIKTSGTFMPVLIAMAFLQTSLLPGITAFIVIVAMGLVIRNYLSYLNLLLVARIATTIVVVIFMMVTASLIGYNLGFNTGMTVAAFPIIILAWTIERMSILWEEEGAKEVFIQGGGSLFVATLAYLAMQNSFVEHLTFNFPELNFILLSFMLFLGRYTGYRLLELYRFREFKGQ